MTRAQRSAQQCLLATCTHLALSNQGNENLNMWRDILRDVLPYCGQASPRLVPVRVAADGLVEAKGDRAIDAALASLRLVVTQYHLGAAGVRQEEFRAAIADVGGQ